MAFGPAEEPTEEARLLNKICTGEINCFGLGAWIINCLGLGAGVILMNQAFEDRLIGVLLHFSSIIRNTRQSIFFPKVIQKKFKLLLT